MRRCGRSIDDHIVDYGAEAACAAAAVEGVMGGGGVVLDTPERGTFGPGPFVKAVEGGAVPPVDYDCGDGDMDGPNGKNNDPIASRERIRLMKAVAKMILDEESYDAAVATLVSRRRRKRRLRCRERREEEPTAKKPGRRRRDIGNHELKISPTFADQVNANTGYDAEREETIPCSIDEALENAETTLLGDLRESPTYDNCRVTHFTSTALSVTTAVRCSCFWGSTKEEEDSTVGSSSFLAKTMDTCHTNYP